MKLFNKDGHLSDEALKAHALGTLLDGDTLLTAEHAADCPACLERLTRCLESDARHAPNGMTELIKLRVGGLEEKRRRDFTLYCVRVAACACIAVAVLMSGALTLVFPDSSVEPPEKDIPAPALSVPAPEQNKTMWESVVSFADKAANSLFNINGGTQQ